MKTLYEHKIWNEEEHKKIEEINRGQQKQIDQLYLAVFGDKGTNEKGMKEKVDEIHEIFIRSGWTLKTFIKILTGLGVSAGSILGIIKLYHLLFN